MDLNDRPADNVPTGASNLCDMTVFVRDRAGWTKNHVVDWSPPQLSLLIDRGMLAISSWPPMTLGGSRKGVLFIGDFPAAAIAQEEALPI